LGEKITSSLDDGTKHLKDLYYTLDQASKIEGKEPFFKITSKGSRALVELSIPKNKDEFKNFIWRLYIIFYEGSGYGKRIPSSVDNRDVVSKIKAYRTYHFHDIEHGEDKNIRKKYQKIGQINVSLIGKKVPAQKEDWINLGTRLVEELSTLLHNLAREKHPAEPLDLKEFFDDRITLFAHKPVKFRKIKKYREYHRLATAPIFLPTFYMTPPPHFGNTRSAIHITSKAYMGNLESYCTFMREIERLWLEGVIDEVLQIDRLMPWSISNDGYMVYGSGVENLLEALKTYDFGIITMILQGYYGEDYSKLFFIIISSYRKGPVFRDNFIDFYLCNIPMERDWINRINDSLDILSSRSRKASSYSLKPYYFYEWNSTSDISLKQILGGMGRNGYDDEREYDVFEGLIVSREQAKTTYKLDRKHSWIGDSEHSLPVNCLDEFVFSATNRPPTQREIKSGKLIGIRKPTVYMLVFGGYGHVIFALNGWGVSKTKR
jgi:hypothetical protein